MSEHYIDRDGNRRSYIPHTERCVTCGTEFEAFWGYWNYDGTIDCDCFECPECTDRTVRQGFEARAECEREM